jgi:hypothetical protein
MIDGPKERPSVEDVRRIEARVGGKFPSDYVSFLQEFNGGSPSADRFEFVERGGIQADRVQLFYGICDDEGFTIERRIRTFSERVPQLLCPIGSDPFGNQLLISLRAADHGAVYFWDHELECDDEEDGCGTHPDSMPRIAASFTEFIDRLH